MKTCTVEGCNRAHRARGLCTTHYNQAHQPSRHAKVETRCTNCGATTLKHKSGDRLPFCDYTCRDLYSIENKRGPWSRESAPKPKREPRDLRSPLRKALEDGDRDGVIAAVRGHSDMRPDGCWEWKRSFKDYYPIVVICGKQKYVHRLTLEAKMGKPLGKQPTHLCGW